MTTHAPAEPQQIRHPGGKDGWWACACICGGYVSTTATREGAVARVRQHAAAAREPEPDMSALAVRAAAGRVAIAWLDAGPVPEYHAAAQVRLLAEWPTLARAVHDLALAVLEDGTG